MADEKTYITSEDEETRMLGQKLAKDLKEKNFLAFYGNLGSGKTTFIQGLALGLKIKRRIISPTFIIVRSYKTKSKIKNQKSKIFYHIDLYRTQTENDLLSVGLEEISKEKNNIVAVEWAEKMGSLMPKKRIDLHFEYLENNRRKITIKYI